MILIGDSLVPYENLFRIYHKEQITETKPNSTIIFKYNEEILSYASANELSFAVIVNSVKEAVYVNALGGRYIIANDELAQQIQKVAENYMFDAKILALINSNEEIENIAHKEIDGVIYNEVLG